MVIKSKYFCELCYNSYTEERARKSDFRCPKCTHAAIEHYLVPIDEPIIDIIQSMNRKGYITQFCCAGHKDSNVYGDCLSIPYVVFQPIDWKILPVLLYNEPMGFQYEIKRDQSNVGEYNIDLRIQPDISRNMFNIYKQALTEEDYNKYIEPMLDAARNNLRVWVNYLPDLTKDKKDNEGAQ